MSELAERPRGPRSRVDDLRRLDWRFLLPFDERSRVADAVLLGADEEVLQVARHVGLADRVHDELPGQLVDLIAVGWLGGCAMPEPNRSVPLPSARIWTAPSCTCR
jgi:hypothetical protein